jgi:multisubunit Na+/H+ antiporter MnhE subunit
MFVGHDFSVPFLIFGVISSIIISVISYQLKLINDKSELLYLSLGFYRHFVGLYLKNFLKSMNLIFDLAIHRKSLHPTIHRIKFRDNYRFNPALLISSINMTTGLFTIATEDDEILIHAIHEEYFYEFDLLKNAMNLNNVNDDNLV